MDGRNAREKKYIGHRITLPTQLRLLMIAEPSALSIHVYLYQQKVGKKLFPRKKVFALIHHQDRATAKETRYLKKN
jgi:hypothetical protein